MFNNNNGMGMLLTVDMLSYFVLGMISQGSDRTENCRTYELIEIYKIPNTASCSNAMNCADATYHDTWGGIR